MDKLKLAHDWAMKIIEGNMRAADASDLIERAWNYADAMQAEAEERKKAEAEQKRKEVREILNDANTFIEREGQHFDDLAPTWDQGPNVLTTEDAEKYKNMIKREFDLYNNPPPKIKKWKSIHAEESDWQPDWSQAPDNAKYWAMDKDHTANFFKNKPEITNGNGWDFGGVMQSNNSHNYQGNWQDSLRERPHGF